ncbi:flagellar biosynthetic protein FliQ [Dyella caseinilytica]|uniref:Flagellar biosynthetic protein FliQ n=1 Tax=Dyella caseinilytica TaxID=1849581 RepID=A0ABX7GNS2_9GAMM|nr:flagellar biosynthetic protein FliQ [Dyella caseinilytica]QRN52075.1 flagellar biosynthetic protein FliQ [Dyella caseinilytica]GGA15636.1 flagellar biosynthesis protein FliQ [Dyella caseinilytica]
MDSDTAMHLLSETLLTAAKVSAPILLATLVIGVVISILQVVTQIQEMTLTFIPKLITVVAMFLMTGAWMMAVVVEFSKRLFGLIAGM